MVKTIKLANANVSVVTLHDGSAEHCQWYQLNKLDNLSKGRVLYDEAALALAILPLLMWPATILTAPATLFVVVRFWKAPGSVVPRSKFKFVLAALIALIQIGAWTAAIIALVT